MEGVDPGYCGKALESSHFYLKIIARNLRGNVVSFAKWSRGGAGGGGRPTFPGSVSTATQTMILILSSASEEAIVRVNSGAGPTQLNHLLHVQVFFYVSMYKTSATRHRVYCSVWIINSLIKKSLESGVTPGIQPHAGSNAWTSFLFSQPKSTQLQGLSIQAHILLCHLIFRLQFNMESAPFQLQNLVKIDMFLFWSILNFFFPRWLPSKDPPGGVLCWGSLSGKT